MLPHPTNPLYRWPGSSLTECQKGSLRWRGGCYQVPQWQGTAGVFEDRKAVAAFGLGIASAMVIGMYAGSKLSKDTQNVLAPGIILAGLGLYWTNRS